jgi:glycosyltransferase involved in cell wall biosynthesis
MARVSVTVAIPTYQREAELVATVRCVAAQRRTADEVLVIDQSADHTAATNEALASAERAGRIRWIRQPEASLTKARNRALGEARGEVVLFIDDDVLLPEQFVAHHVRHFEGGRVDAAAGPALDREDAFDWSELPAGDPKIRGLRMTNSSGHRVEGVPHLTGCNHSVRRESAILAGGYDELFIGSAYGEDNDFALRLFERGGRFIYDPEAWLIHLRAPGASRVVGNPAMQEWKKTASALLFAMRHGRALGMHRDLWKAAARMGPLRKETVVRPWRWPWAWASFAYAVYEARWRARHPVVSPFEGAGGRARVAGCAEKIER